jgi:hypothetical protein
MFCAFSGEFHLVKATSHKPTRLTFQRQLEKYIHGARIFWNGATP